MRDRGSSRHRVYGRRYVIRADDVAGRHCVMLGADCIGRHQTLEGARMLALAHARQATLAGSSQHYSITVEPGAAADLPA